MQLPSKLSSFMASKLALCTLSARTVAFHCICMYAWVWIVCVRTICVLCLFCTVCVYSVYLRVTVQYACALCQCVYGI